MFGELLHANKSAAANHMTDKGRLLTDSTVKSHTVVAFASGKGQG